MSGGPEFPDASTDVDAAPSTGPACAQETDPDPAGAETRRSLALSAAGVATVAALVGFSAYAQRTDLASAGHLLTQSQPGGLLAVVGFALLSVSSIWAMHTVAQRAVGLPVSYTSLIRPSLRGHMLNLVTKSNGLAGLVAFTRHGRRHNSPSGAVLGAYLLTTIVQQLAFSLVAAVVFAVLIASGRFSTGYLLAGVAFLAYVTVNLTLFVAATRSRRTIRAIYSGVRSLLPWRRSDGQPDHGSADELFEAAQLIRTNPRGAIRVLAPALAHDLSLAAILAAALHAVGAGAPIVDALVAFGISSLVGIVSFLPAGLGFVEVSSVAVLVASGVSPDRAAAATALYRLSELWLPVMLGVAASGGRVRPGWWRPLRAAAAGLAALTGVVGMIAAAGNGSDQRITIGRTVVGVFRSDHFTTALLAALMFSLAAALWRGKRSASLLAPAVGMLSVYTAPSYRIDILVALIPMILVVMLGAEAFGVRSDPNLFKAGFRRFIAGEIAVAGYGIGGLYLSDRHFRTSTSLVRSVYEGLRLLFLLPPDSVAPRTVHGVIIIESVRLMSMIMATVFVFSILVPLITGRGLANRERAGKVVERWGTSSLAHFTLWNDKAWTVVTDGVVAYHLDGSVALALGGPIGSPQGKHDALAAFVRECDQNGWIPALHQVGEGERELLAGAGFRLQHIGAEAEVDVANFSLEGSHWKSIRSTLRRLERDGHTVGELEQPLDDATVQELRAVSDSWLESGGHRERTFTLGQFSPAYVRSTRVLAVRNAAGEIVAFVNLVPDHGSTIGTFDMMRRCPDSANGVIDLLFVTMIERFREEGKATMSLGMAPLAFLPDDDLVDKGLQRLKTHGDHWFNFEGLHQFKEKWKPHWEPRYLAYRSASELPAVLLAVQGAGELPNPTPTLARGRAMAERFPATLATGGIILWLMIATSIDPGLHERLLRTFGASWPDLVGGQIWRLLTAALVQEPPGFVWGNLLMVLALLPLAEWRYGSRKTAVIFWLGDALTVLPVLVGLRIAGALGNSTALTLSAARDAGSSAGLWALAGALIFTIAARPWRYGVLVVVAGSQFVLWINFGDLFHLQHLVAGAVGFVIAWTWHSLHPIAQRLRRRRRQLSGRLDQRRRSSTSTGIRREAGLVGSDRNGH